MMGLSDAFDLMAFGDFPAPRVQVRFEDVPRPSTPALDALIADTWRQRLEQAGRDGWKLYNGELLRYLSHDASDSILRLAVGPTCYRDFVGTNFFSHHRLAEFGWERFANPVGTTATVITADRRIVYGRRSPRVAYHAGYVHTFGGTLERCDLRPDGSVDVFSGVVRELEEECGLLPHEFEPLMCVGLVRDREIVQPELLFETRTALTEQALLERWRHAKARDEHSELVSLADAADAVVPFIRNCGPIAPVAVAALLLHGRRQWGDEWFRRCVD